MCILVKQEIDLAAFSHSIKFDFDTDMRLVYMCLKMSDCVCVVCAPRSGVLRRSVGSDERGGRGGGGGGIPRVLLHADPCSGRHAAPQDAGHHGRTGHPGRLRAGGGADRAQGKVPPNLSTGDSQAGARTPGVMT